MTPDVEDLLPAESAICAQPQWTLERFSRERARNPMPRWLPSAAPACMHVWPVAGRKRARSLRLVAQSLRITSIGVLLPGWWIDFLRPHLRLWRICCQHQCFSAPGRVLGDGAHAFRTFTNGCFSICNDSSSIILQHGRRQKPLAAKRQVGSTAECVVGRSWKCGNAIALGGYGVTMPRRCAVVQCGTQAETYDEVC